jgi:hypothetical protein
MFDKLLLGYNYFKMFIGISFCSYIYKICFDSSNEKIAIKTKHDKIKYTIKPRIGLSCLYFILVVIFYYTITIRAVFTILSGILLASVYGLDKFDKESLNFLSILDKNKIIRFIWKFCFTLINMFFLLLTPIHNSIGEFTNNIYSNIKNKTKSKFNDHLMGSMMLGKKKPIPSENLDNIKTNISNKNINKIFEPIKSTSEISDYIVNENKKIIIEESEYDIINENNDVNNYIDNKNINSEEESEKLILLFKTINDIFTNQDNDNIKSDKND